MKAVQVLQPKFRVEETLSEIKRCLDVGWSGMGFLTVEFEQKWIEYTQHANAHFLNSSTSGLHLAVHELKKHYQWSDGDEIVSTPLTFISSNHAILYENLHPVLADVDESLCMDPSSLLRVIGPKTRAVMYVGIGGNAAHYQRILDICRSRGLRLILDAAHMAGTKWKDLNVQVGLDADVAVYSFQAVKNCPTADSGMICFHDGEIAAQTRKTSWLGIDKDTYSRSNAGNYKWNYNVDELGFKYHGNSVIAAMGIVSLRYLDEDNRRRNELSATYDSHFHNSGLVEPIKHIDSIISSRHLYQIRPKFLSRDLLISTLSDLGIMCGVHYKSNDEYSLYRNVRGESSFSSSISSEIMSLPLHLHLTVEDVNTIAQTVLNCISQTKSAS